jgi:hypothetical protein
MKIGVGETVDIAHEMAAIDGLRQLFGTPENILFPYNLELEQLCASTDKNLSVNEWSQKNLPVQPTNFELHQVKMTSSC